MKMFRCRFSCSWCLLPGMAELSADVGDQRSFLQRDLGPVSPSVVQGKSHLWIESVALTSRPNPANQMAGPVQCDVGESIALKQEVGML